MVEVRLTKFCKFSSRSETMKLMSPASLKDCKVAGYENTVKYSVYYCTNPFSTLIEMSHGHIFNLCWFLLVKPQLVNLKCRWVLASVNCWFNKKPVSSRRTLEISVSRVLSTKRIRKELKVTKFDKNKNAKSLTVLTTIIVALIIINLESRAA